MTDVTKRAIERAAELLHRAADGSDDPRYCVKWARIHSTIAEAAVAEGR